MNNQNRPHNQCTVLRCENGKCQRIHKSPGTAARCTPCMPDPCKPCSCCPPSRRPPRPEGPSVELPNVACTQGLRLYAEESVTLTGLQTLENVLTINDGPPPYTLESVEITGIQQAILDQQIAPSGNGFNQFSGIATVYLMLDYLDGDSSGRSKFVKLPVPVSAMFRTTDPALDIVFYSELVNGTISNPILSGTTLNFEADVNLRLMGVSNAPERFSVLSNFSCNNPPPAYIPWTCMRILPSSATVEGVIPFIDYGYGVIPFDPDGASAPYTVEDMQFVATAPNVLSAIQTYFNETTFSVSFPVRFTIVGFNGVRIAQESELFIDLTLSGIAIEDDSRFLLNIRPTAFYAPIVQDNVVRVVIEADGSISIVAPSGIDVATTTLTDCGDAAVCRFEYVYSTTTPPPGPPITPPPELPPPIVFSTNLS